MAEACADIAVQAGLKGFGLGLIAAGSVFFVVLLVIRFRRQGVDVNLHHRGHLRRTSREPASGGDRSGKVTRLNACLTTASPRGGLRDLQPAGGQHRDAGVTAAVRGRMGVHGQMHWYEGCGVSHVRIVPDPS